MNKWDQAANLAKHYIKNERQYQIEKWGRKCRHPDGVDSTIALIDEIGMDSEKYLKSLDGNDGTWLDILLEELGEVCRALLDGEDDDRVIDELVHCGAVIQSWLEHKIVKNMR